MFFDAFNASEGGSTLFALSFLIQTATILGIVSFWQLLERRFVLLPLSIVFRSVCLVGLNFTQGLWNEQNLSCSCVPVLYSFRSYLPGSNILPPSPRITTINNDDKTAIWNFPAIWRMLFS